MNFAVTTICPAGYEHTGAFAEVSDSFHHALLQLGHWSTQPVKVMRRQQRVALDLLQVDEDRALWKAFFSAEHVCPEDDVPGVDVQHVDCLG